MAYKILTKNGIDNSNIDGARGEYFNSGMRDGIVQGVLNEGTFIASSSNVISLDTCELRIAGHRIVIDEPVYHTFNNALKNDTRYAYIAQIIVGNDQSVEFSLFIQTASTPLVQDDLYKTISGAGTYQVEIGRFTLMQSLLIEDVVRTIDVITGNGNIDVDYIRIGKVTTIMLETGLDAEVDIENVINENTGLKETNFTFSIPKSAGSIINVGGEQVDSINFISDPQTQITNEISNRQSSDENLQTQITECVNDIDDLKTTDITLQNDINTMAKSDASNLNDSNILNWQNKLNNMTTLTEGQTQSGKQATVVSSYLSSDGLTWYRIWSDGWKECGGTFHIPEGGSGIYNNFTMPLTFIDTPKTAYAGLIYNNTIWTNAFYLTMVTNEKFGINKYSTVAINFSVYFAGY